MTTPTDRAAALNATIAAALVKRTVELGRDTTHDLTLHEIAETAAALVQSLIDEAVKAETEQLRADLAASWDKQRQSEALLRAQYEALMESVIKHAQVCTQPITIRSAP